MLLRLQREFRRGGAEDRDGRSLQLKGLLGARRENERTLDQQRSADVLLCNLIIIGQQRVFDDDLQIGEICAVVQLDEAEGV